MKIASLFSEKTVFSFEIFPPKKTSPIETVYDTLEALQDRLDSVSDMSSLQAELDKILETMNAASRAKA